MAARVLAMAKLGPAPVHSRTLGRRDGPVVVGVKPREHFKRSGEEFITRNLAIIVGVSPSAHVAHAAVTAPMIPAVFVPGEFAVAVGVQAREQRGATGIKFLPRERTVIVGVGAEQATRPVRAALQR
jgi:hypothetical protein